MSFSFTRTRNQLADMVLGKLGVLAAGATPTSADAELVYEALDLRLKEMHRLGVYWRNVTKRPLSFSLTAGINSASATVDILFPISMHVVDMSMDSPVEIIDIRTYAAISDKADTGIPEKVLYAGSAEFIFWPVPISTTTAKVVYESIADDTSASAAVDVDVAMLRWLRDIIAYDLGDHFGKGETTMVRFHKEALLAERYIRALAVERVDYAPVRIDDYSTTSPRAGFETDY